MASQELEERIRKLEDIEEIKKLQAKYAYLVDSLQFDEMADLFTDDIIANYEPLAKFSGKVELIAGLKEAVKYQSMMCHQMMTPLIEVNGDSATATWYLFGPFTAKTPEGEVPHWIQGKYSNEYIRVDGKWKYSKIKFETNLQSPYEDGWVKTRMMGG